VRTTPLFRIRHLTREQLLELFSSHARPFENARALNICSCTDDHHDIQIGIKSRFIKERDIEDRNLMSRLSRGDQKRSLALAYQH